MMQIETGIKETAGELRELIRKAVRAEELKILFPLYWLKSNPGLSCQKICQSLNIELNELFTLMSEYKSLGLSSLLIKSYGSGTDTTLKRNLNVQRKELFSQFQNLQSLGQFSTLIEKEGPHRYNEIHSLFLQCFGIPFHRAVSRLKEDKQVQER